MAVNTYEIEYYSFQVVQLDVYIRLFYGTINEHKSILRSAEMHFCIPIEIDSTGNTISHLNRELQAEPRLIPRNYDFQVPSTLDRYRFLALIRRLFNINARKSTTARNR